MNQRLDLLRSELTYLRSQLREAQIRTPALLGRATPARADRVHRELADLKAEIAAVEHRIAQIEPNRAE